MLPYIVLVLCFMVVVVLALLCYDKNGFTPFGRFVISFTVICISIGIIITVILTALGLMSLEPLLKNINL